jgi:PAS domain S-box-containing protein
MDKINNNQNWLNTSEDRFHALVDLAPDAIFVVNRNGEIEYLNNQASDLFGYTFSELVGQKIELIIPENFSDHHLLREKYFNSPVVRTMGIGLELFGVAKNGRLIPVGISLSPFHTNDGIMVIATVRDITFRKQAEEEIKKLNSELLSLDHAKTIFLQIISHELRTPLHGIISFTNLIRKKIDSPELLLYVDYLHKLSERLENFTNNALNITKLRLKEYEFKYETTYINAVIESIIERNEDMINEKGLSFHILGAKDISIVVDRELFSICIHNIVINALKYSPIRGVITIESNISDTHVEVDISDQGEGFSKESLERQFKLFASEDQHFDENIGLGLALSKMIMDSFSGEIKIGNNISGGAHVQLSIPITK